MTVLAHCTSTRKRKFQISSIKGNLPFRFSFSRKVYFKSERKRPWKILSITTTNLTDNLVVEADKSKEYRSGDSTIFYFLGLDDSHGKTTVIHGKINFPEINSWLDISTARDITKIVDIITKIHSL